jgi:FkbH-like protein
MTANPPRQVRVAVLASSTVELLERALAPALSDRGFEPVLYIAGFGQYRQAVLDPGSGLYGFAPEVVLLCLEGEDLFGDFLENPFDFDAGGRQELAAARAAEVGQLVERLRERLPEATVFLNTVFFPPLNALTSLEYNSEYSLGDVAHAYNCRLAEIARSGPATVVIDIASLVAWLGFSAWRDPRLWCLARSRWSRQATQALAGRYAAAIAARMGRVRKCVVLDLDNTLWGGIIGEDGIQGIRLGEEGVGRAYAEFQAELLNLYRKGILLAICSKNNPDDALPVIRSHPGMRLREEHFAAVRINWEDKASNLRALAEELNIGLDSLVFIDDNPIERSWVREALPEVYVPEWPGDPGDFKFALLELALEHFQKFTITREDRRRGELYLAQAERRKLAGNASSIEDFYRSLDMRVTIGPADSFTIPRVAQLTQKTNQFNLTARRYTEPEIVQLSSSAGALVLWLELTDRFGSNGVVGVIILKAGSEDAWVIDTFLLSCRVMGRTVENAFLGVACDLLRTRGVRRLIGEYCPSARNAPVAELYPRFGFRLLDRFAESEHWELDLEQQNVPVPEWFQLVLAKESTHAG